MFESREWHKKLVIDRTLKALDRNGFEALYVHNKEEAVSKILELVPSEALVGLGGSVTLVELGLLGSLKARGNKVADQWDARKRGASPKELMEIKRLHINSDVFITSTNAITETGELINIDGVGQRVAAMIFGPRKVIVVTGVNKITRDTEEGIHRARNVAAPMNAKRLGRSPPCATTGVCNDCDSEGRNCNVTTIIHRRPRYTDTTIILVGEKLGY